MTCRCGMGGVWFSDLGFNGIRYAGEGLEGVTPPISGSI
jgi:hypothetical protein